MSDVNMPKLSDTMEEGTVLEWKKQDGAEVRRGEVLAEIESDKASFDIEAEADGVLHVVVEQGQAVPVGELIARIGGEAPEKRPAAPAEPQRQEPEAQPEAKREPEPRPEPEPSREAQTRAEPEQQPEAEPPRERRREPEPSPGPRPERQPVTAGRVSGNGAERLKASPIARRLASELGVDLVTIEGTGPDGRIVKEDVLAAAEQGRSAAAPARPRPSAPEVEIVEPNRMQSTIARRMAESKATVPHFYATIEARVDEAVRVRQQLKEMVPNADRVTMTDLLTRACAIALTRFPEVNASWVEGRFQHKRSVSIGLAVPPEKGLGLLVPVVHDVDRKDLVQISIESRQVIERARSGKPAPGDLEGGTFSISNLGMYGVDEFNAIINPPEAAILAVGAIRDAALVEDGQLTIGKVMRMTLSVDHRVFYGTTAAQFLAEVKGLIENPVVLLLPPE